MQEKAGSEAKQIKVEAFPVGTKLLNELMAKLMAEIKLKPVLRSKLYQTNFHTTLSGEAIITLIYHKKLDDAWSEAAELLRSQLGRSEPALSVACTCLSCCSGCIPAIVSHLHVPTPHVNSSGVSPCSDRDKHILKLEPAISASINER